MELLWIVIAVLLAIVVVITIVDIVRRPYSGWATAGWVVLVIVLPFVGSLIYWATRKPSRHDVDEAYLTQEDMRLRRARQPFDSTGTGI
jgi:NADH:ubiquinone oxidoreductase subunit 6 (subunit J)